jgi:hypothetical protein
VAAAYVAPGSCGSFGIVVPMRVSSTRAHCIVYALERPRGRARRAQQLSVHGRARDGSSTCDCRATIIAHASVFDERGRGARAAPRVATVDTTVYAPATLPSTGSTRRLYRTISCSHGRGFDLFHRRYVLAQPGTPRERRD